MAVDIVWFDKLVPLAESPFPTVADVEIKYSVFAVKLAVSLLNLITSAPWIVSEAPITP